MCVTFIKAPLHGWPLPHAMVKVPCFALQCINLLDVEAAMNTLNTIISTYWKMAGKREGERERKRKRELVKYRENERRDAMANQLINYVIALNMCLCIYSIYCKRPLLLNTMHLI